ncbi:MAG: septal ring lytic transglycosylase RlpA family protein [Terriglobales bacterium]
MLFDKHIVRFVLIASVICAFNGTAAYSQNAAENSPDSANFSGVADYYSDYYHGKRTASGQVHDMHKLTAAHRTLRFGTRVKLVNRRNKKSCVVTINDRGPFTKNRVIDVSKEAASQLGLFSGNRIIDAYILPDEE